MGKRGPPREGPSREELEPALREWREQLLTAEQTEQAALQKFGWTVKRVLRNYGIPLKSYYRQQRNAAFEPQHDEAAVEHSPLERKSTEEAQSAGGEDEAGTKKRRLLAKLMEKYPRKTRILLGSTKAVAPSSSPPQHSSASHVFTLPNVGASSSSTTSSPLLDVEPPSSLSAALLGGSSEATTEEADQLYKLPARRQAEETSGHVRGLNCGVGLEGTAKERDYILGLDRRGYEQNRMGLLFSKPFFLSPIIVLTSATAFHLYIGVVVKGKVKYVKTGSVAPAAVRATVEQQIKQPPTVRAKPVVGGARLGGKKANIRPRRLAP
ncbi:hypothetical protein Rhopal_007023-T1 [Rhodotorula paludigena]|uniref:Transmembrane protein n=1 Tax=Rhodotorula paludigena TaxID=86838 RepID=A0AAV5GWV1_9BASI|nr:hypothetical protein Rhopal_007023-T1 [Rhodotorula paludigena]